MTIPLKHTLPATAPPPNLTAEEKALCDSFLDLLTWEDLPNVIIRANAKSYGEDHETIKRLIKAVRACGNEKEIRTMFNILHRFGLNMAQVSG